MNIRKNSTPALSLLYIYHSYGKSFNGNVRNNLSTVDCYLYPYIRTGKSFKVAHISFYTFSLCCIFKQCLLASYPLPPLSPLFHWLWTCTFLLSCITFYQHISVLIYVHIKGKYSRFLCRIYQPNQLFCIVIFHQKRER